MIRHEIIQLFVICYSFIFCVKIRNFRYTIILGKFNCQLYCSLYNLIIQSLLKWNELKKRKTELGKNINAVQEAIFNPKFGEQTSQISFQKMFLPITDKLDDLTNLIALALLFTKEKSKRKTKFQIIEYLLSIICQITILTIFMMKVLNLK